MGFYLQGEKLILGDYHTHTVYSHGKGTIDDNCRAAIKAGLKELAITDHGFNHMRYNVCRKAWPQVLHDIRLARIKYPELKIYLGLETNLLDGEGSLDVLSGDLETLDLLICGYHKFVKASSARNFWRFNLPVFMSGLWISSSANRIAANTDSFIKAMDKYPVGIISHPCFGVRINIKELARAAAHYGVYVELNGKRVAFSVRDANVMLEEGAEFIIDSDAHSPDRVGEIETPLKFVKESGIPFEKIVNWDKLPVFRDKNKNKQR